MVLADVQRFKGYTIFICKECVSELHLLNKNLKCKFLEEMSLVSEAVYLAFKPDKLNYELLGVGNGIHMHWHIITRKNGDTPTVGPIWRLPKSELNDSKYIPDINELECMKKLLNDALEQVLNRCEG